MLRFRTKRAVFATFAILVLAVPSVAADLDKLESSAKLVPGDAAFYTVMLRNREQFDIVRNSRAYAKLAALPAVQNLWSKVVEQFDQPLGTLPSPRELLKDPDNRQLIDLLADMAGQEIFFYGGRESIAFLQLTAQIYGTAQFQRMMTQMQRLGQSDDPKVQARAILQALAQSPDLIRAPDLVIGFRIADAKRAEAQIARLEKHVMPLLEQAPQLKGRLKRTKVGESDFLTLSLDGEMVPWQEIPMKEIEEKPGQFDEVFKKLKAMKLTIALGVRGKYLLLGIGESTSQLTKFVAGTDRLVNRPEFKPLTRYAERRLTSISYVSKELQVRLAMTDKDVNDMVELAKSMLPQAELNEAQQARVGKDLDDLAKDIRKYLPKPGAAMSFSFLTDNGQESYSYDWGENNRIDGSKPLTLLNHVGGSPLMASVRRSKISAEDYQLLVKWIKTFHRHAEEFVVPKMEPDRQAVYDKFMKGAGPQFKRLDEATGKLLLPALADGQSGLAVDAKLTSQQWITMLPATEGPLPMLELGVVIGVSDAAKLRQAVGEYWDVARKLLAAAKEAVGEEFPDIELPDPEIKKGKSGELFTFPLPLMVPVDKKLAPTAGLSDKVAVLTLSNSHAERLLTREPLKQRSLADASQKLAAATFIDWAATVDAVTPWVDIAVRMAAPFADPVVGDSKDLPAQVHTALDVLKVLRNYSSATYFEDGAWVTHGALVVQDVK